MIPAPTSARPPTLSPWLMPALVVVAAILMLVTFSEGLAFLVAEWDRPEYSYGYLIPFIALYMLLSRADRLRAAESNPSWLGIVLLGAGLFLALAGRVSVVYILIQYGFLLTVVGLVLAGGGRPVLRATWVPIAYLSFMIPLPRFIYANLSAELQLISSKLGAAVIRWMGMPVYLEGNVIDLGSYKLQVVDACSGLRYLFPLMSFGFVCAFFFKGRWWQRLIIFLASIPVTIGMNSLRIAVTGFLVNLWGTEQAEGFLHFFEGWVIFVGCLILLFLFMWAIAKIEKRSLDDVLDTPVPSAQDVATLLPRGVPRAPFLAALLVLGSAAIGSLLVEQRVQLTPADVALNQFPLVVGDLVGSEAELDAGTLNELKLSSYFLGTYVAPQAAAPVELYVAYYASQNSGRIIHSPRGCLPAGGWEISAADLRVLPDDDGALVVNRVLIAKGATQSLVYYWFPQRGRNLTNEYLVKWFLFWDAVILNRTDGALVRVMTPVADASEIAAADARLQQFIHKVRPKLDYYLPQRSARLVRETTGPEL